VAPVNFYIGYLPCALYSISRSGSGFKAQGTGILKTI
jgi:hypothetical protein